MTAPARTPWRILPVDEADLPTMVRISHTAFKDDRHTLMKMREKGNTDFNTEMPGDNYSNYFVNPRVVMMKAVDERGEMVGFTNWAKWNFDGDKTPVDATTPFDAPISNPAYPVTPDLPLIDQLGNLSTGHLFTMQERLNRGHRVLYSIGFSVLPDYQSKGVGSAMLSWLAQYADEAGASCWIHLSDNVGGGIALSKKGFVVVNQLEVDLDRYALKEKEGGWGKYTFRYYRRPAKGE